jgi:FAD/FMN-containing dehydrogenase
MTDQIFTSRREFLYKSFSSLVLLSLPLHTLSRYARTLGIDTRSIKELAEGLQGNLILPEDSEYEKYRGGFNKRYDLHPLVIALCRNELDIAHCVKWATRNQIPIQLKSGGHSYENFSSGTGIVINLREMNQIQVDREQLTAEIQPGAQLEKVYYELWNYGLAIPAGSCLTVGIGGLTLGGGQGFLLRSQGLTSDHLSSVRIVTASGDLLVANSNSNSDLLWACQGGGAGSFGVITSLGFDRLLPIDQVTLFQIFWHDKKVADSFLAWQDWVTNTSNQVSSLWGKTALEETSCCMGQFLGEPDQLKELLKPILKGTEARIWETSFIEAVKFFGESGGPRTPVFFKSKSGYVIEKLSPSAISYFLKELGRIPAGTDGWVVFEGYGGMMDLIASDATAFPHRKGNLFCAEYNISWSKSEQSPQMLAWMREFHDKVRPYFSGSVYANYSDLDLEDWGHSYFGKNFERLRQIKKKYDKQNIFQYAQSIPPATG